MSELTVETMFTAKSYEAKALVRPAAMSGRGRKRMLTHVVAEITQKILDQPNANPLGLTITVTMLPVTQPDMTADILVMATCPQYELEPEFFSP